MEAWDCNKRIAVSVCGRNRDSFIFRSHAERGMRKENDHNAF